MAPERQYARGEISAQVRAQVQNGVQSYHEISAVTGIPTHQVAHAVREDLRFGKLPEPDDATAALRRQEHSDAISEARGGAWPNIRPYAHIGLLPAEIEMAFAMQEGTVFQERKTITNELVKARKKGYIPHFEHTATFQTDVKKPVDPDTLLLRLDTAAHFIEEEKWDEMPKTGDEWVETTARFAESGDASPRIDRWQAILPKWTEKCKADERVVIQARIAADSNKKERKIAVPKTQKRVSRPRQPRPVTESAPILKPADPVFEPRKSRKPIGLQDQASARIAQSSGLVFETSEALPLLDIYGHTFGNVEPTSEKVIIPGLPENLQATTLVMPSEQEMGGEYQLVGPRGEDIQNVEERYVRSDTQVEEKVEEVVVFTPKSLDEQFLDELRDARANWAATGNRNVFIACVDKYDKLDEDIFIRNREAVEQIRDSNPVRKDARQIVEAHHGLVEDSGSTGEEA